MSFVGDPYSVDVFISYSHGDEERTGSPFYKQWSTAFWRALDNELKSHLDLQGITVFFDADRKPGRGVDSFELTPLLKEMASNAAIFVPLISGWYLRQGSFCLKELDWWRTAQQTTHRFDTRRRLLPALIWGEPFDGAQTWPEALAPFGMSDHKGVRFFQTGNVQKRPQPFGWPGAEDLMGNANFREALFDLVGDLKMQLREFKKLVDEGRPAPTPDRPSIYLHGRSDDAASWQRACTELMDAGFPVLPLEPDRVVNDLEESARIREDSVRTMSDCHALMVVGPRDNKTFMQEIPMVLKENLGAACDLAARKGRPSKLRVGVIDTVGNTAHARSRELWTQRFWTQDTPLGWFPMTDDSSWVRQATEWLGTAVR